MAYHIYQTSAFVIGGAPFGEGNKLFTLFTLEFGMINASAVSVRAERSKLRYGLQDMSFSSVSIVRGREFWRVTNADLIANVFDYFRAKPEVWQMFARVFNLLRRLIVGEEKNQMIFDVIRSAFVFLAGSPVSKDEVKYIETAIVLRIIFILGYLSNNPSFESVLRSPFNWDGSILDDLRRVYSEAVLAINASLRESQL